MNLNKCIYESKSNLFESKIIPAKNPNRREKEFLQCQSVEHCVTKEDSQICVVLWTSYAMCLHVAIDACVFGGAPREPRCARLARRPACIVDFMCYVSSCSH